MSHTINKHEKYTIVTVTSPKLDAQVAPSLKTDLVVLKSEGTKNMIIDLTETRYCDSSGLSAILIANRLCKESKGTLALCGIQESVMKLITISQLDSVLNIVPTLQEAIDFIFMDEIERGVTEE
jgi:anti-sigma B factor antagonist